MAASESPLVLILGAGINGTACARELALNGVSVVIVDTSDVAFGASSKSTRLIHGGLRYLEYGEFDLVRESLEERTRLLRLAPQFVRPLRLCIPVNNRFSGLLPSMLRFVRLERWAETWTQWRQSHEANHETRGSWLVWMGLQMYGLYAQDRTLPGHSIHNTGEEGLPEVDGEKFPWLCAYSDGQIVNSERWIVALLKDAEHLAAAKDRRFDLYTYHKAVIDGDEVDIVPVDAPGQATERVRPSVIINATGAWGDATLSDLHVDTEQLFGGTKGSHVLTYNEQLKSALHGKGVYAEAADDRLIFVLPFDDAMLIGTTDEPFTASPETATATDDEIDYLLSAVNDLFPTVHLTRDDVSLTYSGIRPLPKSSAKTTGAVTRRHWIEEERIGEIPVLTLVGGKLTTCRALGEQTADRILSLLEIPRIGESHDRVIPGGENYPTDDAALQAELQRIADSHQLAIEQAAAVWRFFGTDSERVLSACLGLPGENVIGTHIPLSVVNWIVENEWVSNLGDLVERRLLLMFERDLSRSSLQQLAELLADCGRFESSEIPGEIDRTVSRLREFYGRTIAD